MDKRSLEMTNDFLSLVEFLRWRAWHQRDERIYTFLRDGETEEVHLTYGELNRQARAIAALLQARGATGQRALLLYPPGLEYITAFFGCLYAGIVAVPAYPPQWHRPMPRLQAIVSSAQATFALTTPQIYAQVARRLAQAPIPELTALEWLTTESPAPGMEHAWSEPPISPDTLAFLQYTSGATAEPKGVMLTHANLLHNLRLIHRGFECAPTSRGVIWLPPYHDMGLIGGILEPLYGGFPVILMAPADFLQRPIRWLQAISRYRGTASGGPNFAYDLCVRKITLEQRATLDLSSWTVAFCGAEPVRADTLERFATAFAPCGFRRTAFYPCYGLAEATLIVSGGLRDALPVVRTFAKASLARDRVVADPTDPTDTRTLVGCGQALGEHSGSGEQQIVIVDPTTCLQCQPDQVGEIWLAGPSVACGYWSQPVEAARAFQATLADSGAGPFLRTGDLGFLHESELFVTGRIKDLIIVRGRNHYPQDIELTVEQSHPALRPGCGAAFSVEVDDAEQLVVVYEVERQHRAVDSEEVARAVRQAVAEQHELQTYAVVLVKTGSMPKTSSGKIQRHACKVQFLAGTLPEVGQSILEGDVLTEDEEHYTMGEHLTREMLLAMAPDQRYPSLQVSLRTWVARGLHISADRLDSRQPLITLGLDSLMAIELKNDIETRLGIVVPLEHLLQDYSLADLTAQALEQLGSEAAPSLAAQALAQEYAVEYPLSYGQRALWFLHQMAPKSPVLNIAKAVRIHGDLNISALQRAFQKLVDRHPALRTTFAFRDDEPVQRIQPYQAVSFNQEDATSWSEASLHERLADVAHQPFDLASDPLLQLHLFIRSAREHILLLVMHHITTDFWSLSVLMSELDMLYPAEVAGISLALPSLTVHYTDYVSWQDSMLASPEGERLQTYWQKQLQGTLPVLRLPIDRPRPSMPAYCGAEHIFTLSRQLSQQIKALAQTSGVTMYMTLLAAFAALLYRYTGQEDILIGSPMAGRSRAQFEGIMGYFMNPVVIRADLSGSLSFTVLLDRVRRTVLAALDHQDYPSHLLVERLRPVRDRSHASLFQTMFILNKPHLAGEQGTALFAPGGSTTHIALGGLELAPVAIEQRMAQFNLTLMIVEVEGTLVASLQYNSDLFNEATMVRLAAHFQLLLEGIVARPEMRIAELPLLTDIERRQLLLDWPATSSASAGSTPDHCIHELFAEQAARAPDAVALVWGTEQISYGELNARANQLAYYLRRLGVGPETAVGICMERSVELMVGILGILKAGGAYVPLDPAYPQERLTFILVDAQIPVLLTRQRLTEMLPPHTARVVSVDLDWEAISRENRENPPNMAVSGNLAYLIYTSGSTGTPKGVMIQHRSLVQYVATATERYALTPVDRVLQFASINFDTSAEEIYPCLVCGATLVLRSDAMLGSAGLFLRQCQDWAITVLDLPTAYWHELVMGLSTEMVVFPSHVRLVIIGGERALPDRRAMWQQQVDHRLQLVNTYGPTEATIVATMYEIPPEATMGEIPIGRAIANTQTYVLDPSLQPVPIGVPGELYISGAGLARGYVNHPELTAVKFIPNPFGSEPGARLYATGDLVRYLADGSIEYLGRIDDQVKIRGFRVELGEIEMALRQHAAVRESVVVVHEDHSWDERNGGRGIYRGNKRLVAYIVQQPGHSPRASDLRLFLKGRLPEYMVPSTFLLLDALPLTPGGKVDRRGLPAPSQDRPELEETFVAPRTPMEEVIAGIWGEILGLGRVGVYDNFFELGGHSLIAIQVITRLRDAFQVELALHCLFETPTVAGLAERLEADNRAFRYLDASPLRPVSRENDLPLSFAQEQVWFLSQLDPKSTAYHVPRAIRLAGSLDPALLEQTFSELVRRHEILRTTFPVREGRPVQVIHPPQPVHIPVVDLQPLPEAERETQIQRLIVEEGRHPFDIVRGPLLRLLLLRLAAEEYVFIMTEHHLIHDGWTQGVLIREFITIYTALSAGQPSPLPDLPIQFADFAYWQRQWLQGEVLETQQSYWRKQLVGAPPMLELPLDRPRPAKESFRGSQQICVVPAGLAESLRALSRREGCTLFMVMLAAFQVLLHRYTGQTDILVGSPVANRRWRETEGLLGMILNTVVLRTNLSGNPTFRDLLQRVREVCLGAYAHQDLPFEKVVEAVRPERSLSYNPLFQVMFAFQDTPTPELALPGVTVGLLESHNRSSKFDIGVTVLPRMEQLIGQDASANASEIVLQIQYNIDILDDTTIAQLAEHFRVLLEGIVAHPECHLADLPLLTAAERQQLLVGWAETAAVPAAGREGQCLHELFVAQAGRTPDAVAVIYEDGHLTYGELDRRANQLARYLRRLGIGLDSIVGVCAERSLELVIGLTGIFKAGAAYMPLDPTYPPHRLAYLIQDARVHVVLAQERFHARLPATNAASNGRSTEVIVVALDGLAWAAESTECPLVNVMPQHLAYVIYTSGSTGEPKGTLIEHQAISNNLLWMQRDWPLGPNDRLLQKTPFTFDVSVKEVFWPLLAGAQVVLAQPGGQRDPDYLREIIGRAGITVTHFVPSMLHEFLARPAESATASLRLVMCGAEALSARLQERFFELLPADLLHLYGPTEAAIAVTGWLCERGSQRERVPLGRPLPYVQLYVLDAALHPVPIGIPGELHIGGIALARGYLNRPAETAAVFIPDPFGRQPGGRLYKTGDLVRYREDGSLEFLGRRDQQVKVRGLRVELGEIEAVLRRHPGVRDAVVQAWAGAGGDLAPGRKRLVSYVVPNPKHAPTVPELRQHLQERLPDYMVPATMMLLEALPLNNNGKVDRQALPAPGDERPELTNAFMPPRTSAEEDIAAIWRETLDLERVGVYDNFFELGGHSLLATQVVSRLRDTFQVELPLRALFEDPTIAGVASAVDRARKDGSAMQLPAIKAAPREVHRRRIQHISESVQ